MVHSHDNERGMEEMTNEILPKTDENWELTRNHTRPGVVQFLYDFNQTLICKKSRETALWGKMAD